MSSINLLDSSLGIQNVMEMSNPSLKGMPEARQIAASVLREAGLEELYSPNNAARHIEQAICPEVGDGDMVRPDAFSRNLQSCAQELEAIDAPVVRQMLREDLLPLLENNELLKAYTGLMIEG